LDEAKPVEHFEVIPSAWPAVCVFLKVQTQWRTGMSALIGFDYSAVRWVIELMGFNEPLAVLDDLQVIEGRLIETLNKRDK
jgi:hypothetical protein|tara:strand:+ start:9502 stop:9744 length:243 start_codon:yes stop_codon:yes gene_type:complete